MNLQRRDCSWGYSCPCFHVRNAAFPAEAPPRPSVLVPVLPPVGSFFW